MKATLQKCLLAPVACLSLWPILAFAQASDPVQNLADCKAGGESCDRSRLSPSQLSDVAFARHGRNISDCRNGYDSWTIQN